MEVAPDGLARSFDRRSLLTSELAGNGVGRWWGFSTVM